MAQVPGEEDAQTKYKKYIRNQRSLVHQIFLNGIPPKHDVAFSPHIHPRHEKYANQFLASPKAVLLVGTNPHRMGIPETSLPLKNFKPKYMNRYLKGKFRSARLTRCLKAFSGTEKNCFLYNYSPVPYTSKNRKKVFPYHLPRYYRERIEKLCDQALLNVIKLVEPMIIVSIGKYAEKRVRWVVLKEGHKRKVLYVPNKHKWPREVAKVFIENDFTELVLQEMLDEMIASI